MISFGLVFMTLSLSIGVNLDNGFLARMGFDPSLLMAALAAFVLTGLIVRRRLALIVLVVLVTLGANLPTEVAAEYGFDPDYLLAALVVLIAMPYARRLVL